MEKLVTIYETTPDAAPRVLPRLLEKMLEQKRRVVVLTETPERAEDVALQLWTYHPTSFLPHGTQKDGHAALQPIWITAQEENPNSAEILVLLIDATADYLKKFDRIVDLGNAENKEQLKNRINIYKSLSFCVNYWRLNELGKWEEVPLP